MKGYLCNLNLATHHFETLCGLFQELKEIMYIECIAPKITSLINGSCLYQSNSPTWGHDVKDNSKSKKSLEPNKGHLRMP